MSRSPLLVLLFSCALGCFSYAQQPPSKPASSTPTEDHNAMPMAGNNAATPAPDTSSSVPMDQPVITLQDACKPASGSTTPPAGCVSSLTRADFEKLINALQPPNRPPMPPEQRRTFASQYAKLLIFADKARELGLENDPRVQQIFQFAKNQILTEALNQHITEQYAHPTDQQIEEYYKQNEKKYEEATLQRIIIPRITGSGQKPKPSEAEEKAYVEKIRARWVAGEDPAKLQKEASDYAGVGTTPPDVNVGARRPDMLPEPHASVFDLKPGEISQPFSDPASFYLYKVVSVRQVPLSEVKSSIVTTVQRKEIIDRIEQIQKASTPTLNEAYFGPETKPQVSRSVITPKGATPPPPNASPTPAPNSSAAPK